MTADSINILHIDDDSSMLEISKLMLENLDRSFSVDSVSKVDEFNKKLRNKKYDVIISDYEMPFKNGLDLLKDLKKKNEYVKFILFSGKAHEEVAIEAFALGAKGYINKQGNPETVYGQLASAIKACVNNKVIQQGLTISTSLPVEVKPEGPFSKENYHALFSTMKEGVVIHEIIYDNDGKAVDYKILDANQAFETLTGLSREYALGKRATKLYGTTQPPYLDIYARVVESGLSTYFETYYEPMQKHFQISVVSPEKGKFVTLFFDVTELKKAEVKLLLNQKRLRQAQKVARIGDWDLDVKSGKLAWGEETYKVFGYPTSTVPSVELFLSRVHPDDLAFVTKSMDEALKGKPYDIDTRIIRTDGNMVWANATGEVEYDNMGKPVKFFGMFQNITERKKAKEESRKSRLILENSSDSIIVTDLSGKITSWNKGAEIIFGYTTEEMIGQSLSKIARLDEKKVMASKQFEGILGGKAFQNQWEGIRKDGSAVWLIVNTRLLTNEKNEPIAIVGFGKDITQYKGAETKLRLSEERLKKSQMVAHVGYWDWVLKTGEITWSEELYRIFGFAFSTAPTLAAFMDAIHSEDQEAMKRAISDALKGQPLDIIYRIIRTDGEERVLNSIGDVEFDHDRQPVRMFGTIQDITERKKDEQKLESTWAYIEKLLDSVSSGIVVIDCETRRIVDANPAALDLIHACIEDVVGKVCHNFICPNEIGNCPLLDKGQYIDKSERILIKSNGEKCPIIKSVTKVEHNGKFLLVESFQDISLVKAKEAELKASYQKLELINEKLRVVGGLSRHDVRNKLSAINSYAYLAKKKSTDRPELIEFLVKMEQLVKDSSKIFDFAKMYEQIGVEGLVDIDVEKSVTEATDMFSNFGFKVINDCRGLVVKSDSLLRQSIYNFIDNTTKYGGNKTTAVRIYYQNLPDNSIQLIYEDDGVGIPFENKAKLFTQGFSTGSSTGFGLFLTKKMFEVYGWSIKEEGEPGKGAKFVITIPHQPGKPQRSNRTDGL